MTTQTTQTLKTIIFYTICIYAFSVAAPSLYTQLLNGLIIMWSTITGA